MNNIDDIAMDNIGWICPVCGRGNAPQVTTCPCKPFPITYINNGDNNV